MTSSTKYIGMDVHKESISIAVRNATGKIVMECVIETKANTILQFFDGLRGDVQVTFEEGTWAAWLYDLLKPHVGKLVVCDPRRNALLGDGNQNDRVDARKLSDLLYMNKLHAVYHENHGLRTMKELGRSYLTITRDLSRKPGQKNHQVLYTTKELPGLQAGYTSSPLEDSIAKEVWSRMQPKSPQQPRSSTTIRRDGTPYSYLLVALYDGPQNEISRTGIFLLEGKGRIVEAKIDDINGEWCDGCAVPTSDGGIASVYSVVNMFTAPQFPYPLLMLDTSTVEDRSITLATFTPEKKYSDYLLYEYTVGCG